MLRPVVILILLMPVLGSAGSKPIRVLTLNLRAGYDDARAREAVIAAYLRKAKPDIVLFQEVAPPGGSQAERVLPPGYTITAEQNAGTGRGLAIATRHALVTHRHVSLPGRGRPALGAIVEVRGAQIAVVNVHLSPELDAGKARRRELERGVGFLVELGGPGLIGGDFNFGDGAAEEAPLAPLRDAFRARRRRAGPGYTWDIRRNPLAARNGYRGEPSRRLDRILARGCLATIRATIVLNRPVRPPSPTGRRPGGVRAKPVMASDHFGLLAEVRVVPKRECRRLRLGP